MREEDPSAVVEGGASKEKSKWQQRSLHLRRSPARAWWSRVRETLRQRSLVTLPALGGSGANVVLERSFWRSDGHVWLRPASEEIELKDKLQNIGACMVSEVSFQDQRHRR
jgi:hypothetical protein